MGVRSLWLQIPQPDPDPECRPRMSDEELLGEAPDPVEASEAPVTPQQQMEVFLEALKPVIGKIARRAQSMLSLKLSVQEVKLLNIFINDSEQQKMMLIELVNQLQLALEEAKPKKRSLWKPGQK